MSDLVNHPSHYTSHPSGVECITITQHHNFCIGNAMKYLWRQGLKEGAPSIQDLEKARWYIQTEIDRIVKKNEDKVVPYFDCKCGRRYIADAFGKFPSGCNNCGVKFI